ncbi:MAG: hypothetical protein ACO25M_05035 [Limnohabitans sp.]
MRTAPYSDLQASIARLLGLDPDNLDASEFGIIRDGVNRGLANIARRVGALGFQRCEERWFRDHYVGGTAYVTGDEVFFPATQTYYQAIQPSNGEPPAIETNGVYAVNPEYWAESKRAYTAADWSSTTAYDVGAQVYDPATGLCYQAKAGAPAGTLPTNTSYWYPLVRFDPYVPPIQTGFTSIGRVVGVFAENPRAFAGAPRLPWRRSEVGVQVYTEQPSVWIEFQVRPHRFNGVAWSNTATYTAVDDEAASSSTASSGPRIYTGTAAPEGTVTAVPGSIYIQQVSSTATQTWVKATGTGNTGWVG